MQPLRLDGSNGPLFGIYSAPAPGLRHQADLLFVPPFAEEMNRSRRMTKALATRLSAAGCGMLNLDLFGIGDSTGEFVDANLHIWRNDLRRGLAWLTERDAAPIGMVGLRLGALLAMELLAQQPPRLQRIVLWQPVVSGEQMLTQFLRVLAIGGGNKATSSAALRTRLAAGEALEIAGYDIFPGQWPCRWTRRGSTSF